MAAPPTAISEWVKIVIHYVGAKRSEDYDYDDYDVYDAENIAESLEAATNYSELFPTLLDVFTSRGPVRFFMDSPYKQIQRTLPFEPNSLACVKVCIAYMLRRACSRAEPREEDGGWTCPELEMCRHRLTSALLDKPAVYTGSCEKIANRFIKRGGAPPAALVVEVSDHDDEVSDHDDEEAAAPPVIEVCDPDADEEPASPTKRQRTSL